MCQKSSYEKRCEDCNSRVIIIVVTHQVCRGKPPVYTTGAEKAERRKRGLEIPYREGRFICQRRIRPYRKYWSYVGSHACMLCSLPKLKKEADKDLERLLADENRTETKVQLKENRLKELREQIIDTRLPEEDYTKVLPQTMEVDSNG
ncbi:hypothetical protein F52700_12143 [Fusarium sp. NRRL 52700]|nr:hypothetical protein F52700_12143 [Fusarium sp. NRRL 52700]